MRFLLDTHAFLWFVLDDKRLSSKAKSTISDRKNEIYFSAASAWEMAIKTKLARLKIKENLSLFVINQLSMNNFTPLSITISHSLFTEQLPQIHKDPFDRMLIAQSTMEDLPLISKDKNIEKYKIKVLW